MGIAILSSGVADPDATGEAAAVSSSGTFSPVGNELAFAEDIMICHFGGVLIFFTSLSFYWPLCAASRRKEFFFSAGARPGFFEGLGDTPSKGNDATALINEGMQNDESSLGFRCIAGHLG